MLPAATLEARAQATLEARAQASIDSLLGEARRFEERGVRGRAETLYERVLSGSPQNVDATLGLARLALASNEWQEAGEWSERALRVQPESFEAHYIRAIGFRERAKYRLLTQHLHWAGAEEHFEWIVRRDSLYRDVLLQYARLKQYGGDHLSALRLGEAQVRLRRDLVEARKGLFDLYGRFVRAADPAAVRAWSSSRPGAFSSYFLAEKLRLEEENAAAESMLAELRQRSGRTAVDPQVNADELRIPILLSSARVRYARGDAQAAQELIEQAVKEIDSSEDAHYVFDQIKYIVTDAELNAYRSLRAPAEYRKFFRDFWARHDPMPARSINVRMAEHYRRLDVAERDYAFDGVRFWFNNPDKLHVLEYPAAYHLNGEFNDKGVIYLRHGEPKDRVRSVGAGFPLNESWRYTQPEMDFHFVVDDNAVGNNWRLTPVFDEPAMLRSREIWGGIYFHLLRTRSVLEYEQYRFEMADRSRETVRRALGSHSHTWSDTLRSLDFSYVLAAFRDGEGQAHVELHALVPDELVGHPVEVGRAVYDADWRPVAERADTLRTSGYDAADASSVASSSVVLPSGRYHVALHMRGINGPWIGGYRFDYTVPDLYEPGVQVSDLLLYQQLDRRDEHPGTAKGRRPVVGPEVKKGLPLQVYFEIYDLDLDTEGRARYVVEYQLVPENGRRKYLGLFGPVIFRPSLSLSVEHEENDASVEETSELDLTNVEPGAYVLTVRVKDPSGDAAVERTRRLQLH